MIITKLTTFCNWFLYGGIFMVFEKVKEILADQLGVDEDSIELDSLLVEDLGADSLDGIDIVMSVEDEFGIEVPDEVIESMSTVEDIVKFIEDNK